MQFLKESFSWKAGLRSVSLFLWRHDSYPWKRRRFPFILSVHLRISSLDGEGGGRQDGKDDCNVTITVSSHKTKCPIVAGDFSVITSALMAQTENGAGRDRNQVTLQVFCTFQLLCRCLRGSR